MIQLNNNNNQKQTKQKSIVVVRVRIELTSLGLSAPRSADWANGPTAVLQLLKYMSNRLLGHCRTGVFKRAYFGKEWGVAVHKASFFRITRVIRHSKVVIFTLLGWTTRTFVVVPVECRRNVIQWFCARSIDTPPAFYEQINEEKRTTKRKKRRKGC